MWLLLFFTFFLCEALIHLGQGQEYSNETEEVIREYEGTDMLKYPLSNGFISGKNLLQPVSVWGCEKYSAAVYVVTKRAITFAKEVTIYLQSSKNDSEETTKISSPLPVKELKLNVLRAGIDLYRDLMLIVKVMWHDFSNAILMLGEELSGDLELQVSKLPLTKI